MPPIMPPCWCFTSQFWSLTGSWFRTNFARRTYLVRFASAQRYSSASLWVYLLWGWVCPLASLAAAGSHPPAVPLGHRRFPVGFCRLIGLSHCVEIRKYRLFQWMQSLEINKFMARRLPPTGQKPLFVHLYSWPSEWSDQTLKKSINIDSRINY